MPLRVNDRSWARVHRFRVWLISTRLASNKLASSGELVVLYDLMVDCVLETMCKAWTFHAFYPHDNDVSEKIPCTKHIEYSFCDRNHRNDDTRDVSWRPTLWWVHTVTKRRESKAVHPPAMSRGSLTLHIRRRVQGPPSRYLYVSATGTEKNKIV